MKASTITCKLVCPDCGHEGVTIKRLDSSRDLTEPGLAQCGACRYVSSVAAFMRDVQLDTGDEP